MVTAFCGFAMNKRFILERNNNTIWKLEGNNNDEFWNITRTIHFGNWKEKSMMLFETQEQIHFWKLEQNKEEIHFWK